MSRMSNYLKRYLYAGGMGAYALTAGQASPRHRALVSRICEYYQYDPDSPQSILPSADQSEVAPDETAFSVIEPSPKDGNVTLFELMIIVKLVRIYSPKVCFEIGTFDGRTSLNMAANSPDGAKIFTLDLPASGLETHKLPLSNADRVYVNKKSSGARFAGSKYEHRITQLLGDSATFDFSPYYSSVDFVFVDGAHTYEYVISDTEQALKMLRNGKGVILWHDYGRDIGTTYALHDLFKKDGRFSGLKAIRGTALAVCEYK